MRVAIVMNSKEQQALAGARIRYQRIAPHLAVLGHSFEVVTIANFSAKEPLLHDAYLFSKCQDARSILVARTLRARGRLVGVDGFDDYFSQTEDSRLVRQRLWLDEMSACCDFFLCSTQRMHMVLADYLPGKPGHVLNDPYEVFSADDISPSMERRLEAARAERHVEIAWFGVGDNPSFSVGIADLVAQAPKLAALRRCGFSIKLSVLTNRRALTTAGLMSLRRIDANVQVDEWSLEAEAQLLRRSLVAFLPVNAQPFSIAKSLNRAVTAITAGAQVLSPNYPLYKPLNQFIYESAEELAEHLQSGVLKLSKASLPMLAETLCTWGDPIQEAHSLAAFLDRLAPKLRPDTAPQLKMAVLAGVRSPTVVAQLAARMGQLTVGGLFAPGRVDDDVLFIRKKDQIHMRLSSAALAWLSDEAALQIAAIATSSIVGGKEMLLSDLVSGTRLAALLMLSRSRLAQVADYPGLIAELRQMFASLLPDVDVILSEAEAPFAEAVQ